MGVAEGNVGLAFGLVIMAGLSTTIGSSFVFCSSYANTKVLAAALGCSAGVMLYVSFGEIFSVKAIEGFQSTYSDNAALRLATLCFFSGIALTYLMDWVVHKIGAIQKKKYGGKAPPICAGCDNEHCNADAIGQGKKEVSEAAAGMAAVAGAVNASEVEMQPQEMEAGMKGMEAATEQDREELKNMGLLTGLAIALHNFPEGLATFVAALADAKLGIALAMAIAVHNIPEGICVAMPVYYATGSKWKGFLWSFLSGVSEPIGGLFGYLILYGSAMSDVAYGALFGVVGGMMVYISLKELLPTALKYDPEDKYVTNSMFAGMLIMALSLILFAI